MYVMSPEELIAYEALVQYAMCEYRDLVYWKWWEPYTRKEKSQDQPSLNKAYTGSIDHFVTKVLKLFDFKSRCSGDVIGSGGGSSSKSNVTYHNCGKNGHDQKDCRSKENGSTGNLPKKSTNVLPEWVTNKPVVSYTKITATSTMTHNNKNHKWCISCNNGNVTWGFDWKYGRDEWENKKGKKSSVRFDNPTTNEIIYSSYLTTTIQQSTEEE